MMGLMTDLGTDMPRRAPRGSQGISLIELLLPAILVDDNFGLPVRRFDGVAEDRKRNAIVCGLRFSCE